VKLRVLGKLEFFPEKRARVIVIWQVEGGFETELRDRQRRVVIGVFGSFQVIHY